MFSFFNETPESKIGFNTLKELAHQEYSSILKNHIEALKDLSLDELDQLMKVMDSVKSASGNRAAVFFTILEKKLKDQQIVTLEEENRFSSLIPMLIPHLRVRINASNLELGFTSQPFFSFPLSYAEKLPGLFKEHLFPKCKSC